MAKKSIAPSQNPRNDLSAEFVRSILCYNPKTGFLYWKNRTDVGKPTSWAAQFAGKRAGSLDPKTGYFRTGIRGSLYLSHRLIWIIMTNEWPKKEIDHLNNKTKDNRWKNLRESTRQTNCRNRIKACHNTSGFKGVSWYARRNKWVAQIKRQGVSSQHIGYFNTAKEAHKAYCKAATKYFKEFAHSGRP